MTLSIRLPVEDERQLERAAAALHISKSEFIRRSIAAYASKVVSPDAAAAEIDALHIGRGGGLRRPEQVKNPARRAILERLREKHGYPR
ncbi:MAG: ribbon-helix-helix domain-containing protein [Gammaproteobacteria bacterium]|nr:ribbon-helix-helix domain-containing protein [Gammaproteobacteria bacterium]MBU1439824.1 ribbon-helix-helix domain-containing protein [Gammaproteobacteria bacterium]